MSTERTGTTTNPFCIDGGPDWCCIDSDGTGLWCESCLDWVHESDCGVAGGWPHRYRYCMSFGDGSSGAPQ